MAWRRRLGGCALAWLGACAAQAVEPVPAHFSAWTHAGANTAEGAVLIAAAQAFNRSQPRYAVDLYTSNPLDYVAWVDREAVADSLPCVLEVDGPYLARFALSGYLRPLDGLLAPSLRADLLPSILDQGRYEGAIYGVGQFESGLGLWANRRYLQAAGVRLPSVQQPWSLAEFEQALARLGAVPGVRYPLDLALYSGTREFPAFAFLPLLAGFGGDMVSRGTNGRASGVMDGPGSVAAMRHLQDWLKRGWTQPVFDRNDDFERGRTALLWTGHWKYADLHRALGDDLVLLPLPDFGAGLKTSTGSWTWTISSTCTQQAGAAAFVDFLLSPEQVAAMSRANGAPPARRSVLAASPLHGPGGPLAVYAQQLSAGAGVPRPRRTDYPQISAAFSTAFQAIVGGADPQAALHRAADSIRPPMAPSPDAAR